MKRLYIGLGSNLGKSSDILKQAWQLLGKYAGITTLSLSSFYRSAPVGMESENLFVNAVGALETNLAPLDVLDILQKLEYKLGRVRDPECLGYQDRTLDLDLLYYGELCCEWERLELPHPRLYGRLFVLKPLLELAPQHHDPQTGQALRWHYDQLCAKIASGEIFPQPLERF